MTENPMIAVHGPGPEGATCGECKTLRVCRLLIACWVNGGFANSRYLKRRWPACGLWKERE